MMNDDWMIARPDEDELDLANDKRTNWWWQHNEAVSAFRRECVGVRSDLRREERGILSLAWGINHFLDNWWDRYDPPMATSVVWPLIRAFRSAINHDLGRLNSAVLLEWCDQQLVRAYVDPETGVYTGPA